MQDQEAVKSPVAARSRIGELKALRDEIRVNIHLAGMDLRDEWHALEKRLPDPDRAAQQIKELTTDVVERFLAELRRFRARVQPAADTGTIARLMTHTPATCRPWDSLAAAVSTMWTHDVGFLPVIDDAGAPVGVLTDRDACVAAWSRGLRMDDIRVDTVIPNQLWTCKSSDSVDAASKLMAEKQVRRLPVVAEDGKLLGIVTVNDLARASLDATERSARSGSLFGTLATIAGIAAPRRSDGEPAA